MKIQSNAIELQDVGSIVPNPKNANIHSSEQIKALEKQIKYQGFRNPLIVSKRTGFLVAGHGRLEAAKNLGMQTLPVIMQDFDNEAQEYSYVVADNEIARWAHLDTEIVFQQIEDLKLDVELLGIKDFDKLLPIVLPDDAPVPTDEEKYLIIIECKDELEQMDLFEEFQIKEINCKLMS